MPLRRTLVLAAGLVALAAPALSSCGFDNATDRPNVIANGGYDIDGNMRVLGTRIVATTDGQGIFVGTITLNPTDDAVTSPTEDRQKYALTGIATAPGATSTIDPVSGVDKMVSSTGIANLADPSVGGIPVTGSFKAGDIVPITLTFADGENLTVQTPVVPNCSYYAGAGQSSSAASSPSATASEASNPGPYDCAYPSLPPIGE